MLLKCCVNMSAHLENSAVATGLENVSYHSNPKQGQCQRMFKLPHNCTSFTGQQGYAQNPSNFASALHEPRTSRCSSWIQKRQRNQRSNCHICWIIEEQGNSRNISTSVSLTMLKPLTVWIITNYKTFLKRWEYQTALLVS